MKQSFFVQWIGCLSLLMILFCGVHSTRAEEDATALYTLKSSIQQALKESTVIQSAMEGVLAAKARKAGQLTEFLPKFSAGYSYTRKDEEIATDDLVFSPENLYEFSANVDQPLFKGFHLVTQYRVAGLDLDLSQFELEKTRQDIILQAKEVYFGVLQAERLVRVAEDAVMRLAAHEKVARNFYEVGMTPKNDLLEAEVALANARQELVVAENRLQVAYAEFNTLLRRPINAPVALEDILTYRHMTQSCESAWETAKQNRTELKMADLQIAIAERNVQLTRKDYMPDVNLRWNYSNLGDTPNLRGGEGVIHPDSWNVVLSATWTFWEWGKTRQGVREKLSLLAQAKEKRKQAEDDIRLEVKKAYLKLRESEKNILTIEKAIEQAQENLRMNEERYRAQVATSTDVLDARTLLSKTETNYYNALSDYNIAKAQLARAIGIEAMK